jgi:signal transduction histidine kinase
MRFLCSKSLEKTFILDLMDLIKLGEFNLEFEMVYFSEISHLSSFLETNFDLLLVDIDTNLLDDSPNTFSHLTTFITDTPLVLIGPYFNKSVWNKLSKAGIEDYLVKAETPVGLLLRTIISSLERHKLKKRVLESNRELENFAYVASHDLREPLRKVINFGIRLKDKYSLHLGEKGNEYIDIMHDASIRMRGLLDSLLDYSRVNTREISFKKVKIAQIIRDIQSDFSEKIYETAAVLDIQIDETLEIEVEIDLFRNLLQNIINNAIKFRKPNTRPKLLIKADSFGTEILRIDISDNGIGFDPALKEKVFHQFMRVHGKDGTYQGNGMGLATAKKIAERHGGYILAESELGEGSTFSIFLPRFHFGMKVKSVS